MTLAADAVTLCYSLYAYADAPKIDWLYHDDGSNSGGVYWSAVRYNGMFWVVNRGSVRLYPDWVRDFYDWVDPFLNDALGPIHPGFYQGLPIVCEKVLSLAEPDETIGVTGHSLGAGRGRQEAGLLIIAGRKVHIELFGEPHGGMDKLAEITAKATGATYRTVAPSGPGIDDHDLVTAAPPWFNTPQNRLDYPVTPPLADSWVAFKYHHCYLYARGAGASKTWAG